MSQYSWANGSRIKADASAVGECLDELNQENGGKVTPRIVVDAARPDESALHPCFEWDDLRAAELFREDQARYVLRSIRVVHQGDDKDEVVHAYVSIVDSNSVGKPEAAYVPIAIALSDIGMREQLIRQAVKELEAFERKYAMVSQLTTVFATARAQVQELLSAVSV